LQSISCSIEGISAKKLHAGKPASPLLELSRVLVRFDQIATLIVNAKLCEEKPKIADKVG
jgi:hypothetical protein